MINAYLALLGAIFLEVTGTLLLPLSEQFTKTLPTIVLAICYITSFYCLTIALKAIPLAICYASWAGLGVFTIALLSYFLYGQILHWQAILGLFLIVNGVVLVNVYSNH